MRDTHTGWFLVYTKPRHENIAKINLQRQGFHTYLPLLQQQKRRRNLYQIVTEPLFPRYLFIHLSADTMDWSKIRSTRGCISLVSFGSIPARVPHTMIEHLEKSAAGREVLDPMSHPAFHPGDHVQILDGVLAGYEGIVENQNSQQRISLLLNIAEGHTRSVLMSINQIKIAN